MTKINQMTQSVTTFFKKQPIWITVVVCILCFSVFIPEFATSINLLNLLLQLSINGIIAVGMTILMISGDFDLSIGAVLALVGIVVVELQGVVGIPLAIVLSILLGCLIGAINGFFVAKIGINAFVTTLAAMNGVRGVAFYLTKEQPVYGRFEAFEQIGMGTIGAIPIPFLIFVVIWGIGYFILKYTLHGRNTYAIGGNIEASRHAGIRAGKHLFINFVICSALAGVGGILTASRMNSANPTLGINTLLLVITAVVLGGTRLKGGYGSLVGTLGGIIVINIISNGLNLLNVQVYYQMLITGMMLILVIFIDKQFDPFAKWTTQ